MHPGPIFTSAWLEFCAILDPKYQCGVSVEGIGATTCAQTIGSVRVTIRSIHTSFTLTVSALVIASITSATPTAHVDVSQWRHLSGLELADPHFGTPGGVDLLLGADVWGLIVERDIIYGGHDEPHAQLTRLGWVIFGPAVTTLRANETLGSFNTVISDESHLEDLVSSFWKLEEVPADSAIREDDCERIFSRTHQRAADGRYIVYLPLREDGPMLGDSFSNALQQFLRLERRLAVDTEMRANYIAFMREYASLHHMERVTSPREHHRCYYIPHHAVKGKFRVVFNASAPTTTGVSLNDIQLVGPPIQDSLLNIILRFRQYPIALTADVEKMFRQVLVAEEHRDFQRILWRESPTEDIVTYRLTTVTYGMACSPHSAIRAMNQCAWDNCDVVPDHDQATAARDTILSSFYVDDLLVSCNNEGDAVSVANNVDKILAAGCFKLRKWHSNSIGVLTAMGVTASSSACSLDSSITSVLGLHWDPVSDCLLFKVSHKQQYTTPTKRKVLSEVAQLFDPTGLLSPVVISGKIFIQTLWSAGLSWDAPLPSDLYGFWDTFRCGLETLKHVRVPRWLGMEKGHTTTLFGFCDASQRAYAAVVYARTADATGQINVSLLTARTKVAPLKGATIPRLELNAALLLARTLHSLKAALQLFDIPCHLWSDSTVALCWLRKHYTLLKPYVSNRVKQIQELTTIDQWHYVRSAQNPADCASRGIPAGELLHHPLWWTGPPWLKHGPLVNVLEPELLDEDRATIQCEEKVQVLIAAPVHPILATRRLDGEHIPLTERFSSLKKLLRTMALLLRWLPRRRHLRSAIISASELEDALELFIRMDQEGVFANDINCLQKGQPLPTSSTLLTLNPYLDDRGILRVGGRIARSELVEAHRHPIILPKSTNLVRLLINQTHLDTLHGGAQLMLQTLRFRYWVLHARTAVRTAIHKCVVCRRHRGSILSQQMASLPRHRVTAARPFLASGLDYCGPFTLRVGLKRSRTTVKAYLAIFVCMATKAVHLEVVDDLSSQAFLDAYTRFVSRRGPCRDLYSDNGTAFVGANRLLQEDLAVWFSEQNQQSLAHLGTRWHFITPSAPHQGGLWEAAVKSAKRHLVRVVGAQSMWYTQLHTLATRIEACLNSRPLVPLYDDPADKYALTPGDFLVGCPLIAVPEPDVSTVPPNRIKHWQWLRQLHQLFWQRWSDEYLVTLQARSKWQKRVPNIRVGDIVLVRHEHLPPTHWRLGRITEVHPGSDGLVRNATLSTANGLCIRAVQKLCLLMDFEPEGSTGQDV